MLKKHCSQKNYFSSTDNNSQIYSNFHPLRDIPFNLKDLWLRKSFFCPPSGLDQSYASRNHIAGADIPLVEVVHSSQRWLLVQTPKFSRNFFKKLNWGKLGNPYEHLMRVFKGFVGLSGTFGYFRPTNDMIITLEKKQVRVWVNQDIFSNQPQMPLNNGKEGEKQFVVAFLAMIQSEMQDWERAINVCTIDETIKLLEWRSRLNRNSYTAMNASKQVFHIFSEGGNSINKSEFIFYQNLLKEHKSVNQIDRKCPTDYLKGEMSCSITVQQEENREVPKKINKLLSYSKGDMKASIYDQIKMPEQGHEVRRTKKKFALTSTSSTLERFSEKLGVTIGKRIKLQKMESQQKQKLVQSGEQIELERKKGGLHKSEPITIANELQGLFQGDQIPELKLGVEGNRDQLQKIAEEIEQVLIW